MRINKNEKRRNHGIFIPLVICLILVGVFFLALKGKKIAEKEEILDSSEETIQVTPFNGSTFEIAIYSDAYKKLAKKRTQALEKGLLFSSKDDLVDADIKIDGKEYACKLRLKGDLLDHLETDRWSFRIMLKDNEEWNGINTFSIHNSKARSHTAEWLMHQLFAKEGIIVPAYDFINVQLNGKDLGVYAFEHHFENQLLKNNDRDIGPILKHNDDSYWENIQKKLTPFPWVESSHIELFNKENKNDPDFKLSFDLAHSMLDEFVNKNRTASEVFDLDLMGKYFALLDLSHAWHAALFTNIRFYLNNFTGKLEPIAFDCFGDHMPEVNKNWEAYGEAFNSRRPPEASYAAGDVYRYLLFQDEAFFKVYMTYLEKFTNQQYLNQFKQEITSELDSRVAFINEDELYKGFKSDWETIFGKAFFTRKKLEPKPSLSLKAYRVENSKEEIAFQSFHYFPMEVIGFGDQKELNFELEETLVLEAYNSKVPVRTYLHKHNKKVDYIYYRTLGLTSIHKTPLLKNSIPKESNQSNRSTLSQFKALNFVVENEKEITISSGKHSIDFPVVIPKDKVLKISAGTELHFQGKGNLLSYSPIHAIGSKVNPIKFSSDGQAGSAILISGVEEKSTFKHCDFLGMSNYASSPINVDGTFNIYRSKVNIEDCRFFQSKAKTCLSLRYCEVEIINSGFEEIAGTAIHSKHSSLVINKVKIKSAGRNGLSVESGFVNIANMECRNILNKVFNFSNMAEVYAFDVNVYDSYQSLFASDHSEIKMIKFWNENLKFGFEVRSKEDHPTKVVLENFNHKGVEQLYLLKQGVTIKVNGKTERG